MTPPLFVAPRAVLAAGDELRLDGPEGRHAAAVRRVTVGEAVALTDGEGLLVSGVVTAVEGRDALRVTVVERVEQPEPALRFTVVQGIPKGDRGERAVEVLTEAGADAIVPWTARRCVAQWKGERGEKALRRWRSTAREAAKQAHRARHPRIDDPEGTVAVGRRLAAADRALVLHESAETPLSSVELPTEGEIVLVVGPEGGIDPEELASFVAAGAVAVRLGPTVLRTSTAGVVALGALMSRTARWA